MVKQTGGETGIAIVEVYDTERESTDARLANVSSRGFTGTDPEVIIPGFVVFGDATMRILVRGVGETLGGPPFDVPGVLPDPMLEFRDQSQELIGANNDWSANPGDQAATSAATMHTGAFGLPAGSRDAAKVFLVGPGQYTAVVSGVDEATGVCIAEAYEPFLMDRPTRPWRCGRRGIWVPRNGKSASGRKGSGPFCLACTCQPRSRVRKRVLTTGAHLWVGVNDARRGRRVTPTCSWPGV